jgi:uncharacterized membrane protein
LLSLFATVSLLLSCTPFANRETEVAESDSSSAGTFYFECDDQFSFVARVEEGHVWLFMKDVTVNLPRRRSASGKKYQSTGYLFWIKGNGALLESDRRRQCKNNHARAVWEAARLDGVDFRAVGNEPAWLLELAGDRVVLETDYGTSRYEFRAPQADVDVEARITRYQVAENGQALTLELKGQRCKDTMSGEIFPTRVSVTLNGRILKGCGRALH